MNDEIDWSTNGTVTINPGVITLNTGITFTGGWSSGGWNTDDYDWERILEECPYEYLKKEFRKRNLKKLLGDK